ncbi:MAG: cobalt ECF transporter T component CbiQ [Chloroflexi bacterium]|nr:cobalt ECF transporter T component CbiQ [Chloroflexota bacterium]
MNQPSAHDERDCFIYSLDPRTKIVAVLLFVLFVVATPPTLWGIFLLYFVLIAALILLARLSFPYILSRSLVVEPFVLMSAIYIPFFKAGEVAASLDVGPWQIAVTYSGLAILGNVLIKAWLSSLGMLILSSTTDFSRLLKGLEQLRLPLVIVMVLSFMYRYIFVLMDEAQRLRQARESRSFGKRPWDWEVRTIGNMIGTLFMRSYERGERVYQAMLARGYEGRHRPLRILRFERVDLYFMLGFVLCLALIALWGYRGV